MLKNNLALAFRHLKKNRTYAAINIFGLAVAIAACLLIHRILRYELSFGQNFENHDRIVRVIMKITGGPKGEARTRGLPIPAMLAAQSAVNQFEHSARIHECWPTLSVPNPAGGAPLKKVAPNSDGSQIGFFAEPAYLKIFQFNWLSGNPATVLNEVNSIVLDKTTAEKCFDSWQNAIGKTLMVDNQYPVTVRGVFEDLPKNCDFPSFALLSYSTLRAQADIYYFREDEWGSTSTNDQLFALLRNKNDFENADMVLSKVGQTEMNRGGGSRNRQATMALQRFTDIHFDDEMGASGTHVISRARLWILAGIGFLVLAMACFNFINLATALATTRAREVGVRKAVGGARLGLVAQFMTETALVVALAVVAGAFLAKVFESFLKQVSHVPGNLPFLKDPAVMIFLLATGTVVTLLSGLYPAFVLSGYKPVKALKNDTKTDSRTSVSLRQGLVVAQFAIAQALIIGTVVTLSQMDYIRNLDLGFKKDLILTTNFNGDSLSQSKLEGFRQRLLQVPAIEAVAFSSDQPASGSTWQSNFALGRGTDDAPFSISMKFCDSEFQKTFGLRLLAGRWVSESDTTREYVVNETVCRKLGISPIESVVGKELRLGSGQWLPIVGVVRDFHSHSLHEEHEPLLITTKKEFYSAAGIQLRPGGDISETTESVRKAFDLTFPEQVFESRFFDESIAEFYESERRFTDFCKAVAALAVLIGCLGLFGLASHTTQRRTKEIGVRKALGASVASLVALLAQDFLKLVLVAICISAPVAVYLMRKWLDDFAFRIEIQWWMVALTGILAIAIAFLTVGYQSIKAALANPVKSLRSE